jgi:Secretion system C-terminal sorting domain
MKTTSTLVCKLFTIFTIFLLNVSAVKAQCIAPLMVWKNAVLVNGTAGQIGAEYKFPSVIAGVDAFVRVKDIVGGASLTSVDDNTFGYSEAWQPVVKTPTVQGVSTSYVSFKIDFKDSADGHSHLFPCFQLSFIDVDGDNQHVKEFVAAKGADQIVVSNVTTLTLSTISPNFIQAAGTFHNYPGIDTSAYVTNINYNYKNANHINEVRFGNITDSIFTVQDRYSCGYFRPVAMPNFYVLPVKYLSFNANAEENAVTLIWVTEQEINNNHFEVERSFDGINFTTIGLVSGGFENENRKNYQFKDKDAEVGSKSIIYYRLKQVGNDGKTTVTNILAVKLQAKPGVVVQTSPNPFTENLNLSFATTENGFAQITITSINGQKMITKHTAVSRGYNNLQLNGFTRLAPGMYTVQLIINGAIISNQKIIKN